MRRLLDGAPERRVHDARLPDGDVELLEEELEEGEDARGEAEPLLSRNSSAVMDIQSLFIRGEVEPLLEQRARERVAAVPQPADRRRAERREEQLSQACDTTARSRQPGKWLRCRAVWLADCVMYTGLRIE